MDVKHRIGLIREHMITCVECGKNFDMTKEHDVTEWAFGHDCEA